MKVAAAIAANKQDSKQRLYIELFSLGFRVEPSFDKWPCGFEFFAIDVELEKSALIQNRIGEAKNSGGLKIDFASNSAISQML